MLEGYVGYTRKYIILTQLKPENCVIDELIMVSA